MSALPPIPALNVAPFAPGAPGAMAQPWAQYIAAIDALIRAKAAGGAALSPLPAVSVAVVNPATGAPTQPWGQYWRMRDGALRSSGWSVGPQKVAQVIKPLPPTVGFAMVTKVAGTLAQGWAQYFFSVDMIARAQSQ